MPPPPNFGLPLKILGIPKMLGNPPPAPRTLVEVELLGGGGLTEPLDVHEVPGGFGVTQGDILGGGTHKKRGGSGWRGDPERVGGTPREKRGGREEWGTLGGDRGDPRGDKGTLGVGGGSGGPQE